MHASENEYIFLMVEVRLGGKVNDVPLEAKSCEDILENVGVG